MSSVKISSNDNLAFFHSAFEKIVISSAAKGILIDIQKIREKEKNNKTESNRLFSSIFTAIAAALFDSQYLHSVEK